MPKAVSTDYQSRVRKPDDFDAVWEHVLRQAAAIPLEAEVVPDPLRTSNDVEVFEVFYTSLDHVRVASWYCRPARQAEPSPAIMLLPGYQMDPPIPKEWARKGYIALSVAARGKLRSNRQFNPGYPNLLTHNIVDRHTYAYRGFYVDTWRGIDFLLARPEVEPTLLGVTGSSQGGGLTIMTAAMRPEVRAASAGAPYLCGFADAIELTHTYPYEEINDYVRRHPERRADVEQTIAYFDGINFADRISCPIIMNIGLQDNVCPPETGYVLFDRIGAKDKRLYPYDGHGHDAGRARHGAVTEAVDDAASYMFRGIVADSVRGLEFLRTRREVDATRVVVAGNDIALITAALGPGATYVVTTPALFYRTAELAPKTHGYPLEEINDYLP